MQINPYDEINCTMRYGQWLAMEHLPVCYGKDPFTGANQPWQQIRITFIQKSKYTGELAVHKYMYSYPITKYEDNE